LNLRGDVSPIILFSTLLNCQHSTSPKRFKMRYSLVTLALLVVATVVVFSAPLPNDEDVTADRSDLVRGLGMLGLMGLFSLGSMIASHVIKGAIDSHNHRLAIDHFFGNLRKWEAEGKELDGHGRGNETRKYFDDGYDSRSSGFESE